MTELGDLLEDVAAGTTRLNAAKKSIGLGSRTTFFEPLALGRELFSTLLATREALKATGSDA